MKYEMGPMTEAQGQAPLLTGRHEMHYLVHLARLGAGDIHPSGADASHALIEAMDLREGQRLLELGCGTGKTISRLVQCGDVYAVGVDLLPEMLQAARRRLRRAADHCALVHADASTLPFRSAAFDCVYTESSLGIQTEANIRFVLREAFRVLKPGCRFVANEAIWKPDVDQSTVNSVNRQSEADFGLRPASESAWSIDEWLAEIHNAGFVTVTSVELQAPERDKRSSFRLARWLKGLRLLSSPSLLREHYLYRRRLALHRTRGSLLEARLFVAVRPS